MQCMSPKIICYGDPTRKVSEPDSAIVQDGECYYSAFHPRAYFGCIHWEADWPTKLSGL